MSKCAKCERNLESPLDEYGPLMYPLCRDCFDIENDPDANRREALEKLIGEMENELSELEDQMDDLQDDIRSIEFDIRKRRKELEALQKKQKSWSGAGLIQGQTQSLG